jgi:hypothetical protein
MRTATFPTFSLSHGQGEAFFLCHGEKDKMKSDKKARQSFSIHKTFAIFVNPIRRHWPNTLSCWKEETAYTDLLKQKRYYVDE